MKRIICILTALLLANSIFGVDYTWTAGGANDNWDTPANWVGGGFGTIPDGSDDRAIFTVTGGPVFINVNVIIGSLDVSTTAAPTFTLNGGRTLTLSNATYPGEGDFILRSGSFTQTLATSTITVQGDFILGDFTANGTTAAFINNAPITADGITIIDIGTAAANDLSLNNGSNDFASTATTGVTVRSVNDLTIAEAARIAFNNSTISGNLVVNAGWRVIQNAGTSMNVIGTSTFTTGSSFATPCIDLSLAGNNFQGAVLFDVNDAADSYVIIDDDAGGIILGTSNIADDLQVLSTGDITQNNPISVGGDSTFTVNVGQNIYLGNSGNLFNLTVTFVGSGGNINNLTIVDTTPLVLQAITIDGNMIASAGGGLIDSGNLVIPGTAHFSDTVAGGDILLDTLTVSGTIELDTTAAGGDATIVNSRPITFTNTIVNGALSARASGAVAGGDIAQAANAMTVTGAASFINQPGRNVYLNNSINNNFGGTLSFTCNPAGQLLNISIYDASDLALPLINITGNLNARTYGLGPGFNITNTGSVTVTGNGDFRTSGAASNITLGGAPTLDIGTDITLVTADGTAAVTNAQNINFINTSVTGTLTATANTAAIGNITQANAMTVTGAAHFTNSISGGDIVLTTATNAFGGTVEFDTTTPNGDVTFVNNGPVTFNPAAAVSDVNGALNAAAVTGSITDTAASSLDVEGASTFAAAAAFDIVLNETANRFTGAIDFNAYGAGPVRNIELYDTTDVILQALQTSGYLTVTTGAVPGPGGDITDSGNLVVGGYAHFTTLVADDFLNLPNLQVAGTIELDTTGANGDATVTNNQNIEFLNTSVGGDLTAATAAGSISANIANPVTVLGNAHFTTSGVGADIDFATAGTLAVTGTIELDTTAANGDASIINANGIAFGGASVVNGALTASAAAGDITDTGSLAVTGLASFSAGANLITLDTALNSLPTVTIASGANVTLACGSAISLGTSAGVILLGLNVNVAPACTLANNIDVNGNLTITGGTLDVNNLTNRTIRITGDWSNNGGAGTFQERAGTVIFDGAAGRMVSSETFNNLTVWTGFTLDVNGTNLQASGLFDIQNGAILYRNGTTVPIVERAPRDPDSGRVCYRNAGGNVEEYPAGVDYWDLEIAAGAFLLSGNTDIDNSLFLSGGTLDATATPYDINIGGNWVDTAGNFVCQTGTVTFDSLATTDQYITGTTTFYNFVCIIPGKNLYFGAGETTTIATNGRFRIIGLLGQEIDLFSTTAGVQWLIEMSPGSILEMQFVIVHDSYAVNVIITPPDVDVSDNCTRWITTLNVSSVDTVDFDNNGKIDCLHVTAAANVNDDFSGLILAMIDDYAINTILGPVPNGITTGVNPLGPVLPGEAQDDEFYIWLVEKPYLDTYSTPDFRITANSTLYYNALPPQYLVWGPTIYNPVDLADPIIGYTLARADSDLVYVHLSEPVRDAGLAPVSGANFLYGGATPPTTVAPIGTREYLLTYPALTFALADIAGGNTITYTNIVDLAAAPNQLQGAASVTHRLSDLILSFTGHEPITFTLLADATPREPGPEGIGYITRFDGSEWLDNPTVDAPLTYTTAVGGNGDLVWYADTVNAYQNIPLWYPVPPIAIATYGLVAQYQAGTVIIGAGNPYTIPFSTMGLTGETLVEFYVRYGGNLLCARLTQPAAADWYRSARPFAFGIHTPGGQKGGVEIYKNVINPTRGEITKIRYTLPTAGNVTVQVFNLSGDLVDVLYTGWLSAGVHSTTWDGRNRGNRITARGLYFIKVVGPGVDETRKVLVVK